MNNKNLLSLAVATVAVAIAGASTQACAQTAPADVQAVDLGLPSGLKWASCNVGATTPEGYGDYYAWGETAPKTDYLWATCKYGVDEDKYTKYCTDAKYGYEGFTDNKTTLEPADDAATVNWGKEWRMPTTVEMDELIENCTWTWTTQSGVNGYLVSSKTNSNSIFLPASGYRDGTNFTGAGMGAFYWCSSLDFDSPGALNGSYALRIDADYHIQVPNYRYLGQSVRPVQGNGTGTGIGNTSAEVATDAHKVLRNGHVLILHNGKTYTIMGQDLPNPSKGGAQ